MDSFKNKFYLVFSLRFKKYLVALAFNICLQILNSHSSNSGGSCERGGRRDDSVIASNQAEKGRLMPIHTKIKISIFVCKSLYTFFAS